MILPAYFIPASVTPPQMKDLEFGDLRLQVPVLTPPILSEVMDRVRQSQEKTLSGLPIQTIIEAVDRAISLWLTPSYVPRQLAEKALPAITGLSPTMVSHLLPRLMETFTAQSLTRLLHHEIGDPLFLDTFRPQPWGKSTLFGPRLTTHILSGNILGLAVPSIVYTLLTKSSCLVKSASEEPLFASLFARTLAEVAPAIAGGIAVVWWKGGEEELEKTAFARSDAVVAYGSEETLTAVRSHVTKNPATTFIGYGHRVSLGVIGREALTDMKEVARLAAYDVSLYDQQGCLSPQMFYVETGGAESPRSFANALADALKTLSISLPRGKPSPEESASIQQIRGRYEAKEIAGQDVTLYASPSGTDWTVIYEADPAFVPSVLYRTIMVKPVQDIVQIAGLLTPWEACLSTIGVALSDERLLPFAEQVGRLGVTRFCPVGKMQSPPIGWHHDGRFNVLDLLRWVDIDA